MDGGKGRIDREEEAIQDLVMTELEEERRQFLPRQQLQLIRA